MPTIFILALVLLLIICLVGFFVSAYILFLVTSKIFKIQRATYKSSLLISLLSLIISLVIGAILYFILNLINLGQLSGVISVILGFVIFHYLLKKYYQTDLLKNLLIYITYSIIAGIVTVVISLALVIPARIFIMQPFYVSGESMKPNLQDHDYVLLNMMDHDFQRGQVIVYRYPKDTSKFFINRVIGLPGELVSFADGKVSINGQLLDESKYLPVGVTTQAYGTTSFILKADEYFVMGDNRDATLDSRRFGPITKDLIIGKYWFTAAKANQ